ncbi:hypothetical protein ACEZDB_31780 [Streptacidiphilus sp. N1-3]|uniref:Uncharacterized protein n=1 Tax=Streptacidiphilus alkalitolerans TaxID=3342712 RepID=A0ABV6XB56_9ACTN
MTLTRINLASGRTIGLAELRMSSTYGGLLEGYPFKRMNDLKLSSLATSAANAFPARPVHLVPPAREHPDQTPGAFGPVELLPAVTCIGSFTSAALSAEHDAVLYCSALTVVWFQAVPAVPSGDDAEQALRSIPWDEAAEDFEL